ncbi:molybdopterin-dependent oxidoreductase [Desulfonema magnum]|uniref:Molybdopterin oxidoreductase Fe4S4 domain-containing protein n=1 Tax=Desulfonema magnum TaxID=45655 RepID=A0A975GTW4_9BACT|nr:molybdopterin-dependent oxidoreductase [Desulfonema magnum]QTA93491.1 Molybdopterin oxidoreductase Fe4S4 domain-containing protein [Desulfonema magnum]
MSNENVQIVRTTTWSAGPGCHGGCGVLAYIKDGELIKLEGDPDHPWNQGRLCARALAMTQYIRHPNRLTRPLKRVGKRGEGKWKEISWDEAFDLIEKKMKTIRKEYGPESVIFSMGTGRDIGPWICMLAYAFGSPNVMFSLSGSACYGPRISACNTFQGNYCVFDAGQWFPDRYENPKFKVPECMIVWGYNIAATCPDNLFGHWIIDLMKRGTKIISVDPRLTWFSSRAKHWLQLRPGTDAALAMGMLNVLINEDLYDHEFLEKWTNAPHLMREDTGKLLRESHLREEGSENKFVVWDDTGRRLAIWDGSQVSYNLPDVNPALSGRREVTLADGNTVSCHTVWDAFREEVNNYPLDKVEEITWVPAKDIQKAARFYAKSKPASIQWGVSIDMTPAVTPLCHAISSLWALTGNLDVPGGNVITRFAYDAVAYALPGADGVIRLRNKEQDACRVGVKEYGPYRTFHWRAQTDLTLEQIFTGKPYPIKGMWIQTAGILNGIGLDPKRWREALKKLDFIAAVDLFMTPTTQYADVVLPAATFLEKDGVRSWWVPLQSINKALKVEECRPDVEINFELAKRFDPDFKYETIHDLFDDIIKPSGMTYKELQEKVWSIPPEEHPTVPYFRHEKGQLRPDGKPGFKTPTGKFELYSTYREDWGLDPLPHHEEPPLTPVSRPDLAEKYPLILSTGRRSPAYFHSEHRMIPWLRQLDPDPVVEIHPETASEHGIGNGEWVWVENWMGKCRLKAKVSPIVPRWMVMAAHGWWFPEKSGKEPSLYGVWESNINQLLPMGHQGKDGQGAPLKHSLCKIYKVGAKEES